MRDIVLILLLAYPIIMGLRHPWIGVLGWTWVSIMNPHALSWNLKNLPVAAAMAGSTLLGLLLTKDRRNFFTTRETRVLMLFMLWMCITLPFSFYLEDSLPLWDRVMKIDRVRIGSRVNIGPRSTVLYSASVDALAQLGPMTLVMKGETLPAASRWAGNPAAPLQRPAG